MEKKKIPYPHGKCFSMKLQEILLNFCAFPLCILVNGQIGCECSLLVRYPCIHNLHLITIE